MQINIWTWKPGRLNHLHMDSDISKCQDITKWCLIREILCIPLPHFYSLMVRRDVFHINTDACCYAIPLTQLALIWSSRAGLQHLCFTGVPISAVVRDWETKWWRMCDRKKWNKSESRVIDLKTRQNSQWKKKKKRYKRKWRLKWKLVWKVCSGWGRKEGEEERLDVTQYNKMSGERMPEGRAERNRLSC